MKKLIKTILPLLAFGAIAAGAISCSSGKSYAELLTEENHAVNYYLANHRVVNEVPADSVFETGPDAPYYRLNEDGTLYMQVVRPGNREDKAQTDELIYFRFTRYDLSLYMQTGQMSGQGNSNDFTNAATSFRFGNKLLSSASTYGLGIQEPLYYLGVDCEVNLVVKSQLGPANEIASVIPFVYNLRYFRSPL